jgi:tRNA-dihydrouridine synthase B
MAKAAEVIIREMDPDGIDINMGCPAHKVVSSFHGASLMRDPELAGKIVEEVKKVTGNKILSVKTRLGWSDKNEIFTFAKVLEDAGANLLAIHCRTKAQGFAGEPDWSAIKKLKKNIKIPILANGGISNWQSAYECLDQSGADGIIVGQAAIGKPWIFKEIKDKHKLLMSQKEIAQVSLDQVKLFVKNSSKNSIISLRGQLIQYWKGFENASVLRSKIIQCETLNDYKNAIKEYLD